MSRSPQRGPSGIRPRRLIAGTIALVLAGGLATATAVAPATADSPDLDDAFTSAASAYGVPRAVLAAVSYAQTRWEAHAGAPSVAGGWGPMHLIDTTLLADKAAPARDTTLDEAARLTGLTSDALRDDVAANVAGGAALIADSQARLGNPVGSHTDPGSWYAAVAAFSGSTDETAATGFADAVFETISNGQTAVVDGAPVALAASTVAVDTTGLSSLQLKRSPDGPTDCPASLDCEWLEAPYVALGEEPWNYGNHDIGDRPNGPTIDYIVIHNTEETYDGTVALATDPSYLAWNYTIRSSDGHVAQHLNPKDVGWHAGNWYVNMHSIGIEHEGYAAQGAWFTEPMYRASAKLVRYLAAEYGIPLDRAHIIGHDQVPALRGALVPGMHWDTGPYWDWEHYFELLGAPLQRGTVGNQKGDVVRILPGFAGNAQTMTGCGDPGCDTENSNFVALRTEPRDDAPLVPDPGLHPGTSSSTTAVSDIGPRAAAGVDYAVAERRDGWTAIWFLGAKAWFRDAPGARVSRTVKDAQWITPKPGLTSIPVYGAAYPEASAFPAGVDVVAQTAVTPYAILAGQRYALTDETVATDYYKAVTFSADTPDDHIDIVGTDRFLLISFGHRQYYVKAADVEIHRG